MGLDYLNDITKLRQKFSEAGCRIPGFGIEQVILKLDPYYFRRLPK